MLEKLLSLCLIVIGIIHLIPLSGFLGTAQLEPMYDISVSSPELEILMRHRAVLFGLLGGLFIYAAFRPLYQPLAFVMSAGTLLPFFFLLSQSASYNDAIERIAAGDALALACLIVAGICYVLKQKPGLIRTAQ